MKHLLVAAAALNVALWHPRAAQAASKQEVIQQFDAGKKLYEEGRYQEALPYLERSAKMAEQVFGLYHENTSLALGFLGNNYKFLGRFEEALTTNRRALAVRERVFGKNHAEVAIALNAIGRTYDAMGNLPQAAEYFERSSALFESGPDKDSITSSLPLQNLAIVRMKMGRFDEAEQLGRRALSIREAHSSADDPDLAAVVHDRAVLKYELGDFVGAETDYRRTLAVWQSKLGPEHPRVALALHNLGNLYQDFGLLDKAEAAFRRSLTIRQKQLGDRHADVAQSLDALATSLFERKNYSQAEELYLRSIAVYEQALGKENSEAAVPLDNLGNLYVAQEQFDKAETTLLRSLALRKATQGRKHPDFAFTLQHLGHLYLNQRMFDQAEKHFQQSVNIREQAQGSDHPELVYPLNSLGELQAAQQRWQAAAEYFTRERRLSRRYVAEVLPSLTPGEQLKFLTGDNQGFFHAALTLGLVKRDTLDLCDTSAAWLLNGKAVAHEALAARALEERDLIHPQRRKIAERLRAVRQERAALSIAAPLPGKDADRAGRLEKLAAQQDDLERQLMEVGGTGRKRRDPWVEPDEVRQTIPENAVLIDLVRFQPRDFAAAVNANEQPARYVAWLLSPAGGAVIRIIDLGLAEPIDAAVTSARQALEKVQGDAKHPGILEELGESEAEKALRQTLDGLARLLLEPLLTHIGQSPRWIISPDASLWLVPWSALPLGESGYVIEKHEVNLVNSGRDLLARAPTSAKVNPPMVVADPDFDLGADLALAESKKLLSRDLPRSNLRAAANSLGNVRWTRLPGTAAEASAIQPSLERWTGIKAHVYTNRQALEAVVKAFPRPKVAVLSTHGFFLPDQKAASTGASIAPDHRATLSSVGRPLENPLLRCGLVLAGANHKATGDAFEDGILTGLEIVGCDLRGTELVVLSACETGLGDVRSGEGVAGLRQAFQLAGAEAVVATLWQIPDRDTAIIMGDLFANLAAGQSKGQALRNAQLKRIADRRERNGAAHPFFWAAFTLTGGI